MIRFTDALGEPRGVTIGWKRLGAHFKYTRDADGNRCWYGILWVARGNRLHYRYPSITMIGWRPVFAMQ